MDAEPSRGAAIVPSVRPRRRAGTEQGATVALSADGNVAVIGAPEETRASERYGSPPAVADPVELAGTGSSGTPVEQGDSIAISADGNTIITGGSFNAPQVGAAWVLQRVSPTNTNDFNRDGLSDILWRDTGGDMAVWFMNGVQTATIAGYVSVPLSWSIFHTGDFNGDGISDILWHDTSGNVAIWFMNSVLETSELIANISTVWSIARTGGFNGDGLSDILWRDTSGNVVIWFMNGAQIAGTAGIGSVTTSWSSPAPGTSTATA
jgi:hypothetical protein